MLRQTRPVISVCMMSENEKQIELMVMANAVLASLKEL